MGWARTVWIAIGAAYVAALFWAASALPERVASHFDFSGTADGWSSRTEHLLFSGLLGVGILVGMPMLASALSRGSGMFINVPHKDYWLDDAHPDRRVEFRRRFTDDMFAIAALTGALLLWMQVETVWANQQSAPQLSPYWIVAIVAYLVLTLIWTVRVVTVRYRPPPQEPDSSGPIRPVR